MAAPFSGVSFWPQLDLHPLWSKTLFVKQAAQTRENSSRLLVTMANQSRAHPNANGSCLFYSDLVKRVS